MIETITKIQVRPAGITHLRAYYSKQFKESCVFIERSKMADRKQMGEFLAYLYEFHITLPFSENPHSLVFPDHHMAERFTLDFPQELGYCVCYRKGLQICDNALKSREASYD